MVNPTSSVVNVAKIYRRSLLIEISRMRPGATNAYNIGAGLILSRHRKSDLTETLLTGSAL